MPRLHRHAVHFGRALRRPARQRWPQPACGLPLSDHGPKARYVAGFDRRDDAPLTLHAARIARLKAAGVRPITRLNARPNEISES